MGSVLGDLAGRMTEQRTAMVTGASRGIGRAIALALAEDGYDVAITARTVREGTGPGGLPGSLESTAAEIQALGRQALQVPLDLLDRDALAPAAERVLEHLGHLDVLVNNAIYVTAGPDEPFMDVDPIELDRRIFANLTAQLLITQPVLRSMAERAHGTIINLTTGVATSIPETSVTDGGPSIGYICAKGGLHRVAGVVALELGASGVRCYNLEPGIVATERIAARPWFATYAEHGKPPEVVGKVVAWVLRQPDGTFVNGRTIRVDDVAKQLGLVPTR